MARTFVNLIIFFTATLASKEIPIGIVVDSSEHEINSTFRRMLDEHNSQTDINAIKVMPLWSRGDVSNNCDLIKAICGHLESGVFLLLGSSSARHYNIIQSYSHNLHVPYVLYTPSTNQATDGYHYDLSVSPSYMSAAADVIKFFDWHRVHYVYDSDEALTDLQILQRTFQTMDYDVNIDARRLRNVTTSYDILRQLDKFSGDMKRIVLNLSTKEAYQSIMNQIVDVGMNRDNYHYLLTGPYMDTLDLRSFMYGGVNVTGFKLPINTSESSRVLGRSPMTYGPEAAPVSTEVALAADALTLVLKALTNLMLSDRTKYVFKQAFRHNKLYNNNTPGVECWKHPPEPWMHGPIVREELLKTHFKGITGPVMLDNYGQRTGHRLQVLHLEYRRPVRSVGVWSSAMGLDTNLTKPNPDRPLLNANRTRIITTILENPFVMRICPNDGVPCTGDAQFEGYCIDLLKMVADLVKFDYAIQLVKDGTYGKKQKDGTWNGMLGELIREEADIAIAPLTITEVRERVVDFSKPFMDLGTSIMIKEPDTEKGGVFSFKNPLSDGVWVSIICGFVGVSIVLFFVGRFSPYEWAAPTGGESFDGCYTPEAKPAFSLVNTLWFALGALMQQGSDIYPRSISGRIIGAAWWFFTLIIISSYTANLAAFLTIERMEVTINSADDLARQTEIRYGIIANGSTEDFFRNNSVPVYNQMWEFMSTAEPSVFVKSTEEGIEKVRKMKGKYAFLLDSTFNEYHNQRRPCNTMKVGRNLDVKGYGIATPHGSDLRDQINIAVLKLNEVGELLKLYQKWWYDKGQCSMDNAKESKTSALTLSNVSGIFHILIGGLILSMLTAFFDFIIKTRRKNKKQIQVIVKSQEYERPPRELSSGFRQRRASDENGDCRYATLDSQTAFEIEHHQCRHRDRDEHL